MLITAISMDTFPANSTVSFEILQKVIDYGFYEICYLSFEAIVLLV